MTDDDLFFSLAWEGSGLAGGFLDLPSLPAELDPLSLGPGSALHIADLTVIAGAGIFTPIDQLKGLIGGAVDIFEAIINLGGEIWDWLWGLVGGFARWLYDRAQEVGNWLWNGLIDTTEALGTHMVNVGNWVGVRIVEARNFVVSQVTSSANWLWGRLTDTTEALGDHVVNVGNWIGDRIVDARDFVVAQVTNAGNTVMGLVTSWGVALGGIINDSAAWVGDRIVDARDYTAGQVTSSAAWVSDRIVDARDFIVKDIGGALISGAETVVGAFADFATMIGNAIADGFERVIAFLIEDAFEPFVDTFNAKLAIPGKLIRGEYDSPFAVIEDALDPLPLIIVGIVVVLVILPVVSLMVNQAATIQFEPFYQDARGRVGARIPPFAMLRDGFLRGLLPESQHDSWLGRNGFNDSNIALQKALYDQIPGPSDLVRMGVREVFTPEIAERFGQFQDFPPAFGEWMAKQGFTQEWARNFWGAHWDLPSTTQGFEMFHRDVIDQPELELLLRALDVMPYWRDRLIDISYRVISRVDVRRMYAEGVFDRGQVLRVYLDLGYRPEDAEDLTTFVERRYPPKGSETDAKLRDLTAGSIKQAYARRLIDREDALERLQDLDYSEDDAELTLSIWDFDFFMDPALRSDLDPKVLSRSVIERAYERRLVDKNRAAAELEELGFIPEDAALLLELVDLRLNEQLADLEIDIVLNEFGVAGISAAQLAGSLSDLNVPQGRIDFLLEREILKRQAKTARLSQAQLRIAFTRGELSEAAYRARLDAMGYNDADVDLLVLRAGGSLTLGQVRSALKSGLISESEFLARVQALGYSREDAELLLPVVVQPLTLSQLQRAFREDRIDEPEFRTRVQALGIAAADVDLLVPLTERELSVSQLQKAFTKDVITEPDFRARLAGEGFSPTSIDILVSIT